MLPQVILAQIKDGGIRRPLKGKESIGARKSGIPGLGQVIEGRITPAPISFT
jgi:hypothetical protein